MMKTLLERLCVRLRPPVRVGHRLLLVAQTRFVANLLVVQQLVQPLPDQVPRARQEVSQGAERPVDQRPHPPLLNKEGSVAVKTAPTKTETLSRLESLEIK